jgi:hypothetical protein
MQFAVEIPHACVIWFDEGWSASPGKFAFQIPGVISTGGVHCRSVTPMELAVEVIFLYNIGENYGWQAVQPGTLAFYPPFHTPIFAYDGGFIVESVKFIFEVPFETIVGFYGGFLAEPV